MGTIEGTIDTAVKYVNRLILHYSIAGDEWPIMQKESPAIWEAIEQIESANYETTEDAQKQYRKALMNYERMFMRRSSRRGNRGAV